MKITAKKRAKKFGKMNISTYICSHQRWCFIFFSFSHNKTESSGGWEEISKNRFWGFLFFASIPVRAQGRRNRSKI